MIRENFLLHEIKKNKENLDSKLLTSSLHKKSIEKVKTYKKYLNSLNKEDESDLNETNSKDDYSLSVNSKDSFNSNTLEESLSNM